MRSKISHKFLQEGQLFGEVSSIFNCHNSATVRSLNYSAFAYLKDKSFLGMEEISPDIIQKLRIQALEYDDPWIQFKVKILGQLYYFKRFVKEKGFLTSIQFYMEDQIYQNDQIILDMGEECKDIYFVVNGAVDLEVISATGDKEVLETLEQGDVIGQFSVFFFTKFVFKIVAKTTTVRILKLSNSFFQKYGDAEQIPKLKDAMQIAEYF